MKRFSGQRGECLILPMQGQTIVTTRDSQPLRLPGEHRSGRNWKSFMALGLALAFWLTPTPTHAAVDLNAVVTFSNAERSVMGVPGLRLDQRLNAAARAKANDMFAQQYFSHQSPSGQRGWFWMGQAGYDHTEAGENLAMDFADSQDIVTAWMGSSGHRRNMISPEFVDVGVAAVTGSYKGKNTTMVVMLFGRQTSVSATATTSQNVSTPAKPLPPAQVASPVITAPVVHVPAPMVPSLVHPDGVPLSTLSFTLLPPDQAYLTPIGSSAEVLGIATAGSPWVTSEYSILLGWLILGALGLGAASIGLASSWWSSIYPQPQKVAQPALG